MNNKKPIQVIYKNWRGEIAKRNILPITIWYGNNQWHTEEQWFIKALDIDKQEERDFALSDIVKWD